MKYKILRVRAKISYEAFIKKQTLSEMFMSKILDSWNLFREKGIVKKEKLSDQTEIAFQRMLMGDMTKSFQTILEYNTDKHELNFKEL